MGVSLKDAMPQQKTGGGQNTIVDVKHPNGAYYAHFIGLTPAYETFNNFQECKACNGTKAINGATCQACDGTGKKKELRTNLRYRFSDGEIEEEAATFSLFPGGKGADGRVLSTSKLYERLAELSGLTDVEAIGAWGSQDTFNVPCEVRIKTKPGARYPKIVDVTRRHEGNGSMPTPTHTGVDPSDTEDEIPF
jgi:hypothetical protein